MADRKGKSVAPETKGKRVASRPTAKKLKHICILGGKHLGKNEGFLRVDYLTKARQLGQALASHGFHVVYGGGIQGLRGYVATTALIKGSPVYSFSISSENLFPVGTELKVSNLSSRLNHMFSISDAFIFLPGSLGTISELFALAYWSSIDLHHKPIILFNICGYFDNLLGFLDQAVAHEFMTSAARNIIWSSSTIEDLFVRLHAYISFHKPSKQPKDQGPEGSSQGPKLDLKLN